MTLVEMFYVSKRCSQWTDFEQLRFVKHAKPSHMTKLEFEGRDP